LIGGLCAVLLAGCAPSPEELRDKAIAEFQLGRLDKAEDFIEQALSRDPAMPEALYYLGRIRHAQGFQEQAIYYYQCALDADPKCYPAQRWLEKAEQETGTTGPRLQFIPVSPEGR